MISTFPNLNLQPLVFAFNFSKSVAISHAENMVTPNLHNNLGDANNLASQFFLTCYTEGGIFDENTAVIYKDQYGTPLARGHISNWNANSYGITAASGHYHMNIIGGENVFNTPVNANSIEKLQYVIPCYLHQEHAGAAGPYGYTGITYLSHFRLTYVSVFSNAHQIELATKLSLNEFNGISLRDPSATWFNYGDSGNMWLTPVYQNSQGDMQSYELGFNEPRIYSTAYNPTIKWVVPRTSGTGTTVRAAAAWAPPTTYPGLPQSQKQLLYRGNNASASSTSGAPTIWVFQDNSYMFGHTNWEAGHHMAGGSNSGSTYWLTRKSPIFSSSTPNAYGGNNQDNDVFPQSGWYSKQYGGQTYYWNQRIRMFTNTKTD